ncbi:MAG: methylated-DNA--[protein]-cysteine S-methyltransferase [Deltaproteobacteria bacterium]|nr:methylated-DNA--[protein]-cysteine S-methyltransferase [Deltaproteobacteria bacterium]
MNSFELPTVTCTFKSPFGPFFLTATTGGLVSLVFADSGAADSARTRRRTLPKKHLKTARQILRNSRTLLRDYFNGDLSALRRIKLDAIRGTEFQKSVWSAAKAIPPGSTSTYRNIAKTLGKPRAYRAVGNALKANPICLVIPCHRIISSTGKLAGYAGGTKRKVVLLQHEGAII